MNTLALDLCSGHINLGLDMRDKEIVVFSEKSDYDNDKLFFLFLSF